MIRQAVLDDAAKIAETYDELLIYEKEKGCFSNWVLGVYPTIKVPESKIPLGTMYVLEEDGKICGSMVLNKEQAEVYRQIKWKYPANDDEVLVVHTLCIPPSKAGRGYGRQMAEYAKKFAKKQGCKVMRIDTYVHNEPAKGLYTKCGFRLAGTAKCLHEGLIEEELAFLELDLGERDEQCLL